MSVSGYREMLERTAFQWREFLTQARETGVVFDPLIEEMMRDWEAEVHAYRADPAGHLLKTCQEENDRLRQELRSLSERCLPLEEK